MKATIFLVLIFLGSFKGFAQYAYVEFTYDAAGNRTGWQIVIEPINETDSVVKDTNALVQGEMLKQDETLIRRGEQGDVVQGDVQDDEEQKMQQPLINETLALEAETLQLQVFPNPTYGKLNLNFSGALPQQMLQVAVSNTAGTKLFTQDLLFNSNILNLGHLPAGTYYINILVNGKKLKEYKVVKL